jgi:UDP-glucose 4-epimerase
MFVPPEDSLAGRRICVIGASGFIGRHTVNQLLQDGVEVSTLALEKTGLESACREVVGDLADSAVVAHAVEGCDTVIYLAGSSVPATASDDLGMEIRRSVEATIRAAEISARVGANRFIFASSGGTIYGEQVTLPIQETAQFNPITAYGVSKLAVEYYLSVLRRLQKIKILSLRISNPYGELQPAGRSQGFVATAIRSAYTGDPLPIWGDGSATRDYLHVSDVASAFAAGCLYNGDESAINIGSGQGRSLLAVVRTIEEVTGHAPDIRLEPGRSVDLRSNVLDVRLARNCLGWTPKVDFREGLSRTARWWETRLELDAARSPGKEASV